MTPFTTQTLEKALTAKLMVSFGKTAEEATDGEMMRASALVLRDVMAGDTPYIFVKHVYASASLAGALTCVGLWPLVGEAAAMLCGGGLVIAIRILSAHFRWNLPRSKV